MSKKFKETMTVDIKGFSAPFGEPGKKGKKNKKPWYLQNKDSVKESVLSVLSVRKMIAENSNTYQNLMQKAQSGASLNSLIKFNKDILYRVLKKDESEMDDGEKALLKQLKNTYGDKLEKKIQSIKGASAEKSEEPKSQEPKSQEDEDFEKEQAASQKENEKRRQELASRLHVSGQKTQGVSKDFEGQKKEKSEKEKSAKHGLTDIAVGMASKQAEKILPTWTQIDQVSPNFAAELAQAYQRKVGRSIAKDFNKWATVFNDKVVGEIRDFKEKHGIKTQKFDPGTVKAKGAQFTKPRVKQKDQKKLKDPSQAGKRPSLTKFDTIDKKMKQDLEKRGQVSPEGQPQDEMGEYKPGTAEKTMRNVLARYDLSTIADDDLFEDRVRSFAKQANMSPQRLFDFIEVFNRMKDDEEANNLKPAKLYFKEMNISPWNPAELEDFHEFLDNAESAYPPERALKAKMDAPEDSEEAKEILNVSPRHRKHVSRAEPNEPERAPTDIEDYFGDVLKKHWGQEQTSDLGFRNPELKKLMFKLFKDAASSGDKSVIPRDLLPVKAVDEDGNAVVIRSLPDLVRFTTGGTKGGSKMSDQFEEFLIDFSNDYPSHFAALREKTVQVAKKVLPQELESDEAMRAKESGVKPKERKMWKGASEVDPYSGIKGLTGPVPSYKKKGTFDRPPSEEDVEKDLEDFDFGEKASEVRPLSKAGVYSGRDLSSLKSLMGKFLPKSKSEPSNKDLEEIESENDFDLGDVVKKASEESTFDVSRLKPYAAELKAKKEKRRSMDPSQRFSVPSLEKPKLRPSSLPVEKPKDDFDFEDIELRQDEPKEKPSARLSFQDVEDMEVKKSLDAMVKKIIDHVSGKLARGDMDVKTGMKVLRDRLTKMDRWDRDAWDYIKEKVKEEKRRLSAASVGKVMSGGDITKLPYRDKDVSSAIKQRYPVRTPLNLQKKKEEIPESLMVIDGSEFKPTTQNKKGWENGKLSKKKKFEPSAPSLKKAMSVVLLGTGEDCDD